MSNVGNRVCVVDVLQSHGSASSADYAPLTAQYVLGPSSPSVDARTVTTQDFLVEGDEIMTIHIVLVTALSDPSCVVARSSAIITILDDDIDPPPVTLPMPPVLTIPPVTPSAPPVPATPLITPPANSSTASAEGVKVSIQSRSVAEGDTGLKQIVFNLSAPSPVTCGVTARLVNGTTSDDDFLSTAPISVSFSGTRGSVVFSIAGDTEFEADETFVVTLAGSGSNPCDVGVCLAFAVIVNDDLVATQEPPVVVIP